MVYTYTKRLTAGAKQMISEITEMIKRALNYYEFKLRELLDSEEKEGYSTDNAVNTLLQEDINSNTQKIGYAFALVSTGNLEQMQREYKNELCCALINYITGLENSKKSVSEKLYGAKPSFDNIDREILLARQVKTELCK